MLAADFIVDIGPGAGEHGGEIIATGTAKEIMKCKESLTGAYLSGRLQVPVPTERRTPTGFLEVKGARENNLKNIDVKFPLGIMTVVTGVSGSGKSSLVNEILYKSLAKKLNKARTIPGKHDAILGAENLDKIIDIDQSPIGRTPRSNPATYTGVFDLIRDLFAATQDAEAKDVLNMTVDESLAFFEHIPTIRRKIETLSEVGLGYIRLGQPSTELSGGEAQRIKLATELSKRSTGKTIYVLDEPTTGLHFADVHKLINILRKLSDGGNTVIVIEHNLDVIKTADYIIDIGPEGGARGGRVIAEGTPEEVADNKNSYTGEYIKRMLSREKDWVEKRGRK